MIPINRNQHDTRYFDVGYIEEDMEILGYTKKKQPDGKTRNYYIVQCTKCSRSKEMLHKYIVKKVGTSHQACSNSIAPSDKRFYRLWMAMRSRTTTVANKDYDGISSESYKYFIDFYDDMWETYQEHVSKYGEVDTTLDRINPYGDYEKSNIRWATRKVQNSNKRNVVKCIGISPDNVTYEFSNQVEFAEKHKLNKNCINKCLRGRAKTHQGWTFKYV